MNHEELDVWIFQTGEPMPIGTVNSRPMRAISLSNALIEAGHRVTIWTADFNHFELTHRFGANTKYRISDKLEVRMIRSRGYSRNIGFERLLDHAEIAIRLRGLLKRETPPDVAFVGFPPIEPAAVLTRWLSKHRVPSIVDVKDAWPDVMLRAAPEPLRPIAAWALTPYYYLARRCLRDATGISAPTQEFLDWALGRANRDSDSSCTVFPLTAPSLSGSPMTVASEEYWEKHDVPDDHLFRIFFVGALHSSYDFGPVAYAASRTDAQFVICGDGSAAAEIRGSLAGLPNVTFPGWVTLEQAESLAQRSSVALIPIAAHDDFQMNVTNKFYDAISKGLPVLTGRWGVLGRLVDEEKIGLTYTDRAGETLADLINKLQSQPELVDELSFNARRLYQEKYQHGDVYARFVEHVEQLAARSVCGSTNRGTRERD